MLKAKAKLQSQKLQLRRMKRVNTQDGANPKSEPSSGLIAWSLARGLVELSFRAYSIL